MPAVGSKWFPDSPEGHLDARQHQLDNGGVLREGTGAHVYSSIIAREEAHEADSSFDKMFGGMPKTASVQAPPLTYGQVSLRAFTDEMTKIGGVRTWLAEGDLSAAEKHYTKSDRWKRGGVLAAAGGNWRDRGAGIRDRLTGKRPLTGLGTKNQERIKEYRRKRRLDEAKRHKAKKAGIRDWMSETHKLLGSMRESEGHDMHKGWNAGLASNMMRGGKEMANISSGGSWHGLGTKNQKKRAKFWKGQAAEARKERSTHEKRKAKEMLAKAKKRK